MRCLLLAVGLMGVRGALAGPFLPPGDAGLRHDIQVLADAGIIGGAITTWPLSWGDILPDGSNLDRELNPAESAALARVMARARAARRDRVWEPSAFISGGTDAPLLRNFEDSPREELEIGVGASWTGNWAALSLQGRYVSDPEDGQEWRADGSYAAVSLGNWMLAGDMLDRWWGPAWDSSLILSNNARPIPAFTLSRNSTEPFETKWLSWIGHWDVAVIWGFMGDNQQSIPDSRIFGLRVTARPGGFMEIGLSRAAQWCGSGRPCSASTFWDVLTGQDNAGDNVSAEDEPGNQIAGYDVRLSGGKWGWPVAAYAQRIGEDEQNLKPSLFLTQFGLETWGSAGSWGNYRVYLEASDTLAGGNFSDDGPPNVSYNHPIYTTGLRYRGRAFGHTADNDTEIWTLGAMLNDNHDGFWLLTLTDADLNRVGEPDPANTLTETHKEYRAAMLTHSRPLPIGRLQAGLGYEWEEDPATGENDDNWRAYLQWQYQIF